MTPVKLTDGCHVAGDEVAALEKRDDQTTIVHLKGGGAIAVGATYGEVAAKLGWSI
jgi:hypothetical protein